MTFNLSLPFRLLAAYDLSPAQIGMVMASWPLTMMVVAPFAGYLSEKPPLPKRFNGGNDFHHSPDRIGLGGQHSHPVIG